MLPRADMVKSCIVCIAVFGAVNTLAHHRANSMATAHLAGFSHGPKREEWIAERGADLRVPRRIRL